MKPSGVDDTSIKRWYAADCDPGRVRQEEGVADRQRSGASVTAHKEHRHAPGSGVRVVTQTQQH